MDTLAAAAGLEVLDDVPSTKPLTSQFAVSPIRMGKLRQFAVVALPMIEQVMACMEGKGNLVELIENHEQSVIDLVALSSTFTKADYDEMMPDSFMDLVMEVVEVNADFFARNLMPRLKDRLGSIKARLAQAKAMIGQTQSSASSVTGTA